MAEAIVKAARANPLAGLSLPHRVGILAVSDPGPATRFVLRGAASAFGLSIPTTPMRTSRDGDAAVLWLGPDEWLLVAPEGHNQALALRLRDLPPGNAAVDISHRMAALVLEGPAVGDVLSAGCPLDFDLASFPVGMCTRTIFGKAEIVLWREAETRFRLEAGRSFLPYVVGLLSEALRDTGA